MFAAGSERGTGSGKYQQLLKGPTRLSNDGKDYVDLNKTHAGRSQKSHSPELATRSKRQCMVRPLSFQTLSVGAKASPLASINPARKALYSLITTKTSPRSPSCTGTQPMERTRQDGTSSCQTASVRWQARNIEEWRFVFEMELEYRGEGVISATARHSPMNTQVTFSALGSEFLLGKCDGNSGVSTECRSNAVSKETLHT